MEGDTVSPSESDIVFVLGSALQLVSVGVWHPNCVCLCLALVTGMNFNLLLLFQLAITSSFYIVSLFLSFFSCFSLSLSHPFSFVDPHLHCQHLLASVTSYLNAPGKRLGGKEGRKWVCMFMYVCDMAEGHEQVTGSGHNPPLLMSDLPMCPRVCFAYMYVYFVHTRGCGCMCAVHTWTCVCVWMNVWWCEGMSSSRWNALAQLEGGRLIFTLLYGALSPEFHTTLSSYFTTATHSWILYLYFFIPGRTCEIRCHLI